MNTNFDISAVNLRDYAKSRGWVQVPEALKDRLFVLNHPQLQQEQLVFTSSHAAPDYRESVIRAIQDLAEIEGVPFPLLLHKVQEASDDTLRFRLTGDGLESDGLPFAFAANMMQGTQRLLLSAAHSVLSPQIYHPRLSRREADALLEAATFRHTEPGSFVFKVSCPVVKGNDVAVPNWLARSGATAMPFSRLTTLTVKKSLLKLVKAIELDTLDELVADIQKHPTPLFSSNLCDALTQFQDERLKNALEVTIAWAASLAPPPDEREEQPIRFQRDYFPRIEEVYRELRSIERHREEIFFGTVERLNGQMGTDGRRRGEVVLSLMASDGETFMARTDLNAEQYAQADRAHMAEDLFILVEGKLHPGRQPRALTDIKSFVIYDAAEAREADQDADDSDDDNFEFEYESESNQ